MPPIESIHRHQKAVLWPCTGVGASGEFVLDDPVEISVRWENTKSQMLNPEGNLIPIDAQVVVNQEVAVGSRMWLGEYDDIFPDCTGTPETDLIYGVMEVAAYRTIPDLKGRNTRRTLGLVRHSDNVPEVG